LPAQKPELARPHDVGRKEIFCQNHLLAVRTKRLVLASFAGLIIIFQKMKRPQLVSKGSIARLLQAANDARNRRELAECVELLERASRLDPGNPALLLDLGHACGNNFDYPAAENAFERAIRLSPDKTPALVAAGLRARDFGNHQMAEHYYRLASAQKNATAESLVALAELFERRSRLDEAAQMTERALHLNSNFPAALLVRARLERQAGRLNEAETILRSFPTNAESGVRARAFYELGAILDRQGNYADAMSAFLKAKEILARDAAPHSADLEIMRARLGALRQNLTPETLGRWRERSQELKPPYRLALLCGHPRSGTTLLEQVIDSHPEIVSAEETQIFHDFAYVPLMKPFPADEPIISFLESPDANRLRQSRASYFRCMELFLGQPIGSRLLIDKNPSVTFLMAHFIRVFPEIRFLVALRDPRDVCLSCFMQPLPLNQVASAYLTLEGTVSDYIELMTMYQTVSQQMQNERLEVRYEDMVNDLETVSRRVLDFLGVSWDERVLRFHEHAQQKVVRSPTYADVTKPVFKRAVGRWHHYQKYLEPHLAKLEPFAKAFGYET
jgi:tetratricopeptide (TPR) repeat protein